MPSTPWRRRRTTDSPRPAGRRWAGRLRRGGTLARQALLVRVGRRSGESGRAATATRAEVIYTGPELGRRPDRRRRRRSHLAAPAVAARSRPTDAVSLLPGEHTMARRLRFALVNALHPGQPRASACWRSSWPCTARSAARPPAWSPAWPSTASTAPWPASWASRARSAPRWTRWPTCARSAWPRRWSSTPRWPTRCPPRPPMVACVLVAGCAAIRLARFNVSPKDGKFFCGVPTTMAAAVLALTVLIDLPLPGFALLGRGRAAGLRDGLQLPVREAGPPA